MARLLIVDDEDDVREFAANFFRKRRVDVITAGSGEEALGIIVNLKPDLVLLDIKMQGIDGVETLRRLRKTDSTTQVIMVTGKKPDEQDSFDVCCKELGACQYIHKPLELDELETIVMGALKQIK